MNSINTFIMILIVTSCNLFAQNTSLYFAGDTFFYSDFIKHNYQRDSEIKNAVKDKDLFLLNLEGAFCKNRNDIKNCSSEKCYKVIHEESKTIQKLIELNVDYTSLGNNHILDCSKSGEVYTQQLLKSNNIEFSGTKSKPYTIIKHLDKKFAVYSLGSNNFISSFNNKNEFQRVAKLLNEKKMNKEIDYIIVMLHMGTEDKNVSSVVTGKNEYFYGENRGNPKAMAHFLIDNGADVIVGSGPHVLRAIDMYKGKVILYSLGNFYTDTGINTKGINGLSVLANVEINESGDFVHGKLISLQQQSYHKPIIDTEKKSCKRINELSKNINSNIRFDGCLFQSK